MFVNLTARDQKTPYILFSIGFALFSLIAPQKGLGQVVASENIDALQRSFIEERQVVMITDTLDSELQFSLNGSLLDFSKDTMDYSFCSYYEVKLRVNDLKKIEKFREKNAKVADADSSGSEKEKGGRFKKMLKATADAMATVAVVAVAVALDADMDSGSSTSAQAEDTESSSDNSAPSAEKIQSRLADGSYSIESHQWELFENDYLPSFDKGVIERKALRATFTRDDQTMTGILLARTSGTPKVIFIADEAVAEEARIANQMDHARKLRLAAENEVNGHLDRLGEHRSHLLGSHWYLFDIGFQEVFDPEFYPTESFTYPHMRHAFFVTNKNIEGMKPSDIEIDEAQTITLLDSIEMVEFFLDGYKLNNYGYLRSTISDYGQLAVDNSTAKEEFQRIYDTSKDKMDMNTWRMIPEGEWKAATEALITECTGLDLNPLPLKYYQPSAYYDTSEPAVLIGDSYNMQYKLSYIDSTQYKVDNTVIDVSFDKRPFLAFFYSGTSATKLDHGSRPSYLNTSYPVRYDLEGLWPYITVKGNVFVAQAVADAEYEKELERQRQEEERQRRENEKKLQDIADRYGQKYVDAYNNLDIIVGMPEILAADIIDRFFIIKNTSQYGSTTTYQCQSIFDRYSGIWISIKGKRVSSISTY